jgi:hypothetical protein
LAAGEDFHMSIDIVDWEALKSTPLWSPLRRINVIRQLDDRVYKVGDHCYLLAVSRAPEAVHVAESGPYVTRIIWGETDGAVLRAVSLALEEDSPDLTAVPPTEMSPIGKLPEYAAVHREIPKDPGAAAFATYRIATDGVFIDGVIVLSGYELHFRSRSPSGPDLPYVIVYRLKS